MSDISQTLRRHEPDRRRPACGVFHAGTTLRLSGDGIVTTAGGVFTHTVEVVDPGEGEAVNPYPSPRPQRMLDITR